jgi:hypothetical protein
MLFIFCLICVCVFVYFEIVECIATEYMSISKSMANGDLAEQLMKVFINPLEMKMVGWTRAKIHHALTHALVKSIFLFFL